ncbi:MAG: FHA domain-containing protein [Anaerolineales bacterium]|nr:FHA domain-containing protein [Anaerolineales bacterium]
MSVSILMLAARIALAVCLYAFLALVLFALWRDIRAAGGADVSPMRLDRLREDGTLERSYSLRKATCFLGRSPSVEIPLSDETVSVVHARLWMQSGRWWIEDLDSRNGTQLNRIPLTKPAVLCPGDRIRVGRIALEFRSADPFAPAADSPVKDPSA